MIYLDYSATTPVGSAAREALLSACQNPGNPNSHHDAGKAAAAWIQTVSGDILKLLHMNDHQIVYTSGATESNNLVLKGCFQFMAPRGKNHIITTELEHASVLSALSTLMDEGASVDFVPLDTGGQVNLEALRSLIRPETLLVSVGYVNSETGITQPIPKIGQMLRSEFPSVFFHTDATQALGKIPVNFENVDFVSFTAHKFYGFKGIGALIKPADLILKPQIEGGSSTTLFRGGTPSTELIVSMGAALSSVLDHGEEKLDRVRRMNQRLRQALLKIPGVLINSPESGIPHILNFSLKGINADALQAFLNERGICISTRTACSSNRGLSKTVLALWGDRERAVSSVRVSLSHLTTDEELNAFLSALGDCADQTNS